jgi:4-carboxymuconolactone decarboxylase
MRGDRPFGTNISDIIKIGIAIGANSRNSVMPSIRKALSSGSTPEEITHANLLSLTAIDFPDMIAALGWVNEILDQE